ncbi:MAG: hypothetical protein OEN00_08865, partial [Gemmatimonadota bacterium]|nr:hypothetical protein [Gemmatimonadota bacterium]
MRISALLLVASSLCVPSPVGAQELPNSPEEIYVARSLRESREPPGPFCAPTRTGFGAATVEDRYSFWSVAVRPSDGRITDARVGQVGDLQACFGPLEGGGGSFFYAEGSLGGAQFTGRGDCRPSSDRSPRDGIGITRCYMDLGDLPDDYVSGRLTTNTINSR